MARLCRQLCSEGVESGPPISFSKLSQRFSVGTGGGGGAGDSPLSEDAVVLAVGAVVVPEDLDESLDLDERNLSFGFSDSDDDVIEELSGVDQEEAEPGVTETGTDEEEEGVWLKDVSRGENGTELEDNSEIDRLKVHYL